jgi:hypothetical protein
MNDINVDLGIDSNGEYVATLTVPNGRAALDGVALANLMADLATASSLLLANDTDDILHQRRVRILPAVRDSRNTRLAWHRTGPQTSHYVAHTEDGKRAEAFKGEKGWVAVLDGEVLSDVVSKKSHAQRLVMERLTESDVA